MTLFTDYGIVRDIGNGEDSGYGSKTMKRIVLIGPVYPYKGGISHYTGMLCRALRKKYEVDMISYSLQYPRFLYKKEQKDYEDDFLKIGDTKYLINTANPVNWLSAASHIRKEKPDLLIMQWWHPYFAPCYRVLTAQLHRHVRILYVCHNVFPHERFPADRKLTRMAMRHVHCFTVQSGTDEADLLQIRSNAVYRRTVLPTFDLFQRSDLTKEDARKELGVTREQKVLLFFGFVREYKGLKHLLNALPAVSERLGGEEHVRLLVVGDFGSDKETYLTLIENLGIHPLVKIYDGYIPDREVEVYFKAADLAVLPYESATQSGIVQVSYGFSLPVVATNVGGLPDVVTDGVTGYVVEPKRPDLIAQAVCEYFEENRYEEFKKNIEAESYRYSWDRLVEIIEDLGTA